MELLLARQHSAVLAIIDPPVCLTVRLSVTTGAVPIFPTTLSFGTPISGCSLRTFAVKFAARKLESWRYVCYSENGMIVACRPGIESF